MSILRLAPGARLVPHTGSHNSRLVLHVGLQVPDKCGILVGGEARRWEVSRVLMPIEASELECACMGGRVHVFEFDFLVVVVVAVAVWWAGGGA